MAPFCSFDYSFFYFPFEQLGSIGYASTEASSGDRLNPYPYPYPHEIGAGENGGLGIEVDGGIHEQVGVEGFAGTVLELVCIGGVLS